MSVTRNISAVLLFSSLVLTALPVGAISFHSTLSANRLSGIGTTTTIGPPHATQSCALSRVTLIETDTPSENATCQVRRSGTVWILEATLTQNEDAEALCAAVCFNN